MMPTDSFPSSSTGSPEQREKVLSDNINVVRNVNEDELNPDDPNYKHQALLQRIQNAYDTMPQGWSKNSKIGTKSDEAPYYNVDGRKSWKDPNAEEINAIIESSKKEESNHNESKTQDEEEEKTDIDPRLLKKYRMMVKRGVPVGAVKQNAFIINGLILHDSDLELPVQNEKSLSIVKENSMKENSITEDIKMKDMSKLILKCEI